MKGRAGIAGARVPQAMPESPAWPSGGSEPRQHWPPSSESRTTHVRPQPAHSSGLAHRARTSIGPRRRRAVGFVRGFVSAYSQNEVAGTTQRFRLPSHPRHCGLLTLRMFVSGWPPYLSRSRHPPARHDLHQYRRAGGAGAVLGQDRVHAAGPAGRKAMASISIFAFSNRPATCTAVLVGGSFGKNSPRMRENTA
jgi:hypothetical protein